MKFMFFSIVLGVCFTLKPPHYSQRHGDTFSFQNVENTYLHSFPNKLECDRCQDSELPAMHKILKLDDILSLESFSVKSKWTLNRGKDGFFYKKKFIQGDVDTKHLLIPATREALSAMLGSWDCYQDVCVQPNKVAVGGDEVLKCVKNGGYNVDVFAVNWHKKSVRLIEAKGKSQVPHAVEQFENSYPQIVANCYNLTLSKQGQIAVLADRIDNSSYGVTKDKEGRCILTDGGDVIQVNEAPVNVVFTTLFQKHGNNMLAFSNECVGKDQFVGYHSDTNSWEVTNAHTGIKNTVSTLTAAL